VSVLGVDGYIQEAAEVSCHNGLALWYKRESSYLLLAPVAESHWQQHLHKLMLSVCSQYVET